MFGNKGQSRIPHCVILAWVMERAVGRFSYMYVHGESNFLVVLVSVRGIKYRRSVYVV